MSILCLAPVTAQAVASYPYGTLPTGASDTDVTNAYNLWKSRRLVTASCGQRVDNGGGATYSEGMGYGMLMAAYLESTDTQLANLYTFYAANLDSRGLMNWSVASNSCSNNNANAATDGDLDAALALVKAAKKWPASSNNWASKATTLLNNIYSHEVDSCKGLANGDAWGGCTNGSPKNYNPSYFRTGYLKSFDCFEGGTRWSAVRTQSYTVLATTISSYKLPPDWVQANGSYGASDAAGGYGYDSCRTPWAVGMDYLWWGNTTAQNLDNNVTASFAAQGAASTIGDDYNYSTGAKDSNNHENEFIGAVGVASMCGTNSSFRDSLYAELVKTDNNSYFSDSLKVIYLMALTGNFQEPCNGGGSAGTPTPSPTRTPTFTPSPTPTPAFSLVKSASLSTAAVGQTFTYYLSYANLSSGPNSSGVTPGVSLQYDNSGQSSPQNTVDANFQIVNASGAAINLSNYRIRYFYYESGSATPANYTWSSYYDQSAVAAASFLAYGPSIGPPSANLELRVAFGSYSLANAGTAQLQGAYTYSGNPSLTLSDDWSWPGAVSAYSAPAAANIVLEQNVAGTWKPVTGAYPGGAASISNVTITDTFDSRLTYVSSAPAGTYSGGVLSVNFATLSPGQAGNVTVLAAVNATASAGNMIPNQASIGASGFPSVQSAVVNITVVSAPTPTRSATPTLSPTRTRTPSPSATATASPTASPTPSLSPSPSATPSNTPLKTATQSPSASPSPTPSASTSASPTAPPSVTPSRTISVSPSPSATRSPTPTASPSASPTATATLTPSFSVSPTVTPFAGSPTDSPTISPSPSVSPSASATLTVTATGSPSSTPTLSVSPTATPTDSASATASSTSSASPSSTPSPTGSPTATPTSTATASATHTLSPSLSPTFTASPAWTATVSPTVTPSFSATASPTLSPSGSVTPWPSSTATRTPLPGGSPSPTATLSPRVTLAGAGGPLVIGRHAPIPSPWTGRGPASLAVEMLGDCDGLRLRLYTPAMACVGSMDLGSQAKGWGKVALPASLIQGLRSGVYYYSLQADRGEARSLRVVGTWMVLR